MQKRIFLITLASLTAQPLLGMIRQRSAGYSSQRSQMSSAGQDSLLIGGTIAAGAALAYWLYRSNYKSSLKEAHASLDAMRKQYQDYSPPAPELAKIQSREAANPFYREIARSEQSLQTIQQETQKHKRAWEGYSDYRHHDAESLIGLAQIQTSALAELKRNLDHHVALFVLSDSSIKNLEAFADTYQTTYNPFVNITDLTSAQAYQKRLTADAKTIRDFKQDLTNYCNTYAEYPNNQVTRAQQLLQEVVHIQTNMKTIQEGLTPLIAKYELANLYCKIDAKFRPHLSLMAESAALEKNIKGEHFTEAYPLLAYVKKLVQAQLNLQNGAARVANGVAEKEHAEALADELKALCITVVNMPTYEQQKEQERQADAIRAAQLAQERQAREAREMQERIARQERETQERIARENRESKERHERKILEEQRRIANAKELEAAAALEKASAERERVRIERERLKFEKEKAAGTLKPTVSTSTPSSTATISVHFRNTSVSDNGTDTDNDDIL